MKRRRTATAGWSRTTLEGTWFLRNFFSARVPQRFLDQRLDRHLRPVRRERRNSRLDGLPRDLAGIAEGDERARRVVGRRAAGRRGRAEGRRRERAEDR